MSVDDRHRFWSEAIDKIEASTAIAKQVGEQRHPITEELNNKLRDASDALANLADANDANGVVS